MIAYPIEPPNRADHARLRQALERKAYLAHAFDREPATARQCNFLAWLMLLAGDDGREVIEDDRCIVDIKRAGRAIELCVAALERRGVRASMRKPPPICTSDLDAEPECEWC